MVGPFAVSPAVITTLGRSLSEAITSNGSPTKEHQRMTSSMMARSSPLVLGMEMRRLASATISSLFMRSIDESPVTVPLPHVHTARRRGGSDTNEWLMSWLTRDVRTERRQSRTQPRRQPRLRSSPAYRAGPAPMQASMEPPLASGGGICVAGGPLRRVLDRLRLQSGDWCCPYARRTRSC